MRYKYLAVADRRRLGLPELEREIRVRAENLDATELEILADRAERGFPLVSFSLDAESAHAALVLAHEVAEPLLPTERTAEFGEIVVEADSVKSLGEESSSRAAR
jgi:hypothetical protein